MIRRLFRILFLAKEIKSKEGVLHFQRWRILWTPYFAIYIHKLYKSDEDDHMHSHPWAFRTFILAGAYDEEHRLLRNNYKYGRSTYTALDTIARTKDDYHKITLIKPTITLVFTGKNSGDWGYYCGHGYMDFKTYRRDKQNGLKYEKV